MSRTATPPDTGSPKAQRVEHPDHLRAHAHHVAHDPADAGGRPLDREHLARVVVALVRQHQRQVVARRGQRHHPGVLAGPEQHLRAPWSAGG
jgi:hypothetical protein